MTQKKLPRSHRLGGCSWVRCGLAGDMEDKGAREVICVFDPALNVTCEVKEGHPPSHVSFFTRKQGSHAVSLRCVFIRLTL